MTLPLAVPLPIWRPIHYLGSKLRLTDTIGKLIDDLDPDQGSVCDLFAGSGTVSFALSRNRNVIAADIQEYSRVLCSALLRPDAIHTDASEELLRKAARRERELEQNIAPILVYEQEAIDRAFDSPELICDLAEHGSLISEGRGTPKLTKAIKESVARIAKADVTSSLMVTRYFGGSYFSFRQSLQIDSILGVIPGGKNSCLAALVSTASTIVNSVGKQFAQPMRPRRKDGSIKTNLIQQMCRDRLQDLWKVFRNWLARYRGISQTRQHRILRGDYRQVLREIPDASVIYADPPYTRDHYSRFYHVLETLCLRDSPEVSTTWSDGPTSRGLYRTDRHQSPFCIKSQAPDAFDELFAGAKNRPLLLSYSPFVKDGHPRLMTIPAITEVAKRHYRSVKVVPAGPLMHSKLNRADLHRNAAAQAEVFIICR